MKVRWTDLALSRLIEIEAHIARDDADAAARLVDHIVDEGERLGDQPSIGRVVPELARAALRELLIGNYRLIYRVRSKTVEILTVSRDTGSSARAKSSSPRQTSRSP